MRDLAFRDGARARAAEDAAADDVAIPHPAAGRRPRTGGLREALYRHAIAPHPERDRAARAAELIAAAIGTGGAPLPLAVRRRLEAVIHADLSGVRVHTGHGADAATAAVGARAFAVGGDLVFADAAYAPGTAAGDWLLAHEATHAARHRGAPGVTEDRAAEAEASAVADAYVAAGRAPDPARVAAVRALLRDAGVVIDPEDIDRLAVHYGAALGLTRWSLGADRQDAAERIAALVAHAHTHQCSAACAHPPRPANDDAARPVAPPREPAAHPAVEPLDAATRSTVERTTGAALGEVAVERGAELGAGRLGEAHGTTIRLAPAASGDDALARRVRIHEAIHVAQTRATGDAGAATSTAAGSATAAGASAVEAEAHAATAAAERGEPQPLGTRADPARRYGFDLDDAANALGLDPKAFLREHFPQVASLLEGGFSPMLQHLGDAAGAEARRVLGALGFADLQAGFDGIVRSFQPGGQGFGILHGCCECLDHALHDLTQSVQRALDSDAGRKIRGWIEQAQDSENTDIIAGLTDFFATLKKFGGAFLDRIEQADAAIGRSAVWRAVAPLFGLDPSLRPIEAIKTKMSQMWDKVKADIAEIRQRLARLWSRIQHNRVVAAVLRLIHDCGALIAAIRKVREARSRDPKVWLGILARELKGTVFEGLIASLQSGYATVVDLKAAATEWLIGILDATGLLALYNAAVPYLNALGRAIQDLGRRIQAVVAAIRAAIVHALDDLARELKQLWQGVKPYVDFVVGLGIAIALTLAGDILAIPRFVVGQLWLHVLPHCYKASLTDFLLDLFIKLAEWFPAKHPVMILLRSAALAMLHKIKAAPMDQKIGAMDTIAKAMSNDPEVLAGFMVGLVKGLWNSSLGFIVQMAIFPLQMGWDVLTTIGKQVAALQGKAFGAVFDGATWLVDAMANAQQIDPHGAGRAAQPAAGAPGGASAAPGAAPGVAPSPATAGADAPQPKVTTPVILDPSTPPTPAAGGVDTPDSDVHPGAAPGSPPPAPSSATPTPTPAPGGAGKQPDSADGVFEDPPAFPALPPLGDLVDHVFQHGVSRDEIETMFKKFNLAMDQWGTKFGKDAADKLLPYMNSRTAPYDLGEILGEVVGWLAGEIIMLVASEGVENLIAKVAEGAMDGARIMAKIGEYFPKLAEWLLEMRKLIEPLIEAVDKVAAKAKQFLQKIAKWLEDMLLWVKRQWARLLRWIEETFGELGKLMRKGLNWLIKEEGEIEAEAEALEAANYAFEKLDAQLLHEAVPFTALEAKLRALAVPHTPDVQIHLHLVTTTHWRIEATAIKGAHRGVGLSLGRGAVLWTYDTMIPYYTASGHAAVHEALLDAAAQQLYREAEALALAGASPDLPTAYRRVEELTRTTREEYQGMLPVHGTHFFVKLEPITSRDVENEGFSRTEFIITPNAARKWKDIPITGGQRGFLGAYPTGTGRQFKGHFGPVPDPHAHTVWDWNDGKPYPSGPVTRHPANEQLGYQNHGELSLIVPLPVPYTFVGGGTEGALDGDKAIWLAMLDAKIDKLKRQLLAKHEHPTPADEAAAQAEAEQRLLAWYQLSYPGLLDMSDLRLQGNAGRRWQAHHVHEHSWGGSNVPHNFQFLPLPEQHAQFTAWWSGRQARIQQALFGYKR